MANYSQKNQGVGTGGLTPGLHRSTSASAQVVTHERRRSPRQPFSATAEVYEPQSKVLVAGRCSDLSLGGCYIDTINPLPIGTLATIRLQGQSTSFTSPARVIYSKIGMGMGLAFENTKPEEHKTLDGWMRELCGEAPSPQVNEEDVFAASPQGKMEGQARVVLTQLINTLAQKRILSAEEAANLLESLFR